jgi:methylphosphotriester-DNA--protein-cysteine methyltransferase
MFRHRPSCSERPVLRTRAWWFRNDTPGADCCQRGAGCNSCRPLSDGSEFRADLVERIRRAIAEGRYETPEKWEAALEMLYWRLRDA